MDSTERVNLRCSAIVFRGDTLLLLQRRRAGSEDWVLPGGTPRRGESIASCVRREVAEETGLHVNPERVAFLLEAANRDEGSHVVDVVFTASESDPGQEPVLAEPGLVPVFHPIQELATLHLRPPIAGHVRGLHAAGGRGGAAYLGNLWRPLVNGPAEAPDTNP
jgi:ADP-ribose pyrophosphatase YjhB (NUDIX family)